MPQTNITSRLKMSAGWRQCRLILPSATAWYACCSIIRRWVAPAASAACWRRPLSAHHHDCLRSSSIGHRSASSCMPPPPAAPSRRPVPRHARAASCPPAASHSTRTLNLVRICFRPAAQSWSIQPNPKFPDPTQPTKVFTRPNSTNHRHLVLHIRLYQKLYTTTVTNKNK